MQDNTALLIFANTPQQEILDKDFGKHLPKAKQLGIAQALLRHTRQVASSTGLPIVEILSNQQQGYDFAERYTNAIAQVFAQGYSRVISIGTDSPDLQVKDILEAEQKLQVSGAVLGLANDGGAYLIGFDKSHFEVDHFESLPWKTQETAQALIAYFKRQNTPPAFLTTLKTDVDNFTQLIQAFSELGPQTALYQLIAVLLTPIVVLHTWVFAQFYQSLFAHLTGLRAPPQ